MSRRPPSPRQRRRGHQLRARRGADAAGRATGGDAHRRAGRAGGRSCPATSLPGDRRGVARVPDRQADREHELPHRPGPGLRPCTGRWDRTSQRRSSTRPSTTSSRRSCPPTPSARSWANATRSAPGPRRRWARTWSATTSSSTTSTCPTSASAPSTRRPSRRSRWRSSRSRPTRDPRPEADPGPAAGGRGAGQRRRQRRHGQG